MLVARLSCGSSDQRSDLATVDRAVTALGLSEKCRPRPTTPASALRNALADAFLPTRKGTKILVDTLKGLDNKAFAVHEVDQSKSGIDPDDRFGFRYTAVLLNDDAFEIDPYPGYDKRQEVCDLFRQNKAAMSASRLGICLAQVILEIGGFAMRDGGGVYCTQLQAASRTLRGIVL